MKQKAGVVYFKFRFWCLRASRISATLVIWTLPFSVWGGLMSWRNSSTRKKSHKIWTLLVLNSLLLIYQRLIAERIFQIIQIAWNLRRHCSSLEFFVYFHEYFPTIRWIRTWNFQTIRRRWMHAKYITNFASSHEH